MNKILLYGGASLIGLTGLLVAVEVYDTQEIVNSYCTKEFHTYAATGDDQPLNLCVAAQQNLGGGSSDKVSALGANY